MRGTQPGRIQFVDLQAQYHATQSGVDAAAARTMQRGDFILSDDVETGCYHILSDNLGITTAFAAATYAAWLLEKLEEPAGMGEGVARTASGRPVGRLGSGVSGA